MTQAKQEILAKVESEAYLYTKTGLFENLEGYFKACNEAYKVGVKPEELPVISPLKKGVLSE